MKAFYYIFNQEELDRKKNNQRGTKNYKRKTYIYERN